MDDGRHSTVVTSPPSRKVTFTLGLPLDMQSGDGGATIFTPGWLRSAQTLSADGSCMPSALRPFLWLP